MKKIWIILLFIIGIIIYNLNPPYKELNQIKIIKKVIIKCENKSYKIELIEVIPTRKDNDIQYKKEKHTIYANHIEEIKEKLNNNNYYYPKKNIESNCLSKEKIKRLSQ